MNKPLTDAEMEVLRKWTFSAIERIDRQNELLSRCLRALNKRYDYYRDLIEDLKAAGVKE